MLRKVVAPGLLVRWAADFYRGCNHPCAYCYALGSHNFRGHSSGEDMTERIVVKVNGSQVLRQELTQPGWAGEPIAMGVGCDPYQLSEFKYKLMRQALLLLLGLRQPCVILTKSTLILRDLELLRALSQEGLVQVQVSLCSLEERHWQHVEPQASEPRRRLQLVERLVDGGVEAGVSLAPILPDLTDGSEQLAGLAYAAANHGASFLAPNVTSLTPGSVDWYQPQLRELYPHITPQYLRFYKGRYQGSAYTKEVLAEVEALRQAYHLPERRVLPPRTSNRGQLALAL